MMRFRSFIFGLLGGLACLGQAWAQIPPERVLLVIDRNAPLGLEVARQWAGKVLSARSVPVSLAVTSFQGGMSQLIAANGEPAAMVQRLADRHDPAAGFNPEPVLDELKAQHNQWAMILVVVGGDPAPLDSAADRSWLKDPRYAELAAEYQDWQQAQATPKEIQDYFAPFYAGRQSALMLEDAKAWDGSMNAHMVVLDLSGRANRMRDWALAAQVRYVSHVAAEPSQLEGVVDALRWETRRLLTGRAAADGQGGVPWGTLLAAVVLGAAGGGWIWKRAKAARPEPPVVSVLAAQFGLPMAQLAQLDAGEQPPAEPPEPILFQARLASGLVSVHWTAASGTAYVTDAVHLTMDDVVFTAGLDDPPVTVDAIACPRMDIFIPVGNCDSVADSPDRWHARFGPFPQGVQGQMHLLDVIAGIDEE